MRAQIESRVPCGETRDALDQVVQLTQEMIALNPSV